MEQEHEVAIELDGISKDFKLPHEKTTSIKSLFVSRLGRKNGVHRKSEIQHALHNISFSVKRGEFFGIVGRNGSGKSTLLKIIAGIYQPTKGGVHVNGRLVPFIELGVGFNPDLSGRDNVYLNGALMGFSRKHIDNKYNEIVDFAEIEKFMDQKLKNYSSGMQVRLAFSVATILAESDILLIDEVLAVGDADFQRKCFRYFKRLKKLQKTVVFVTHDMNAVREYCDRAILIEKSELVSEGAPENIAKSYERLMQPDKVDITSIDKADRWGDGALTITNATVKRVTDKDIHMTVTIQANRSCDDPLMGFTIKNQAGVILVGTNTMLVGSPLKPLLEGESVTVNWQLSNALSDGEYSVAFAAQYDNGATNGDWWENACSLQVVRANHNPFPIYPQVKASII